MAAPPEKKQRTEGQAPEEKPEEENDVEMKEAEVKEPEQPKVPEPPKELEEDAPPQKAISRIKEAVKFLVPDTTLNVMQSTAGNLLMALTDGGVQHLFAGARANVGVKSGRYMFEVKIVEYMSPAEDHNSHSRGPKPRNLLRVGFSTASSSLIMGDSEGAVCFDSEGAFLQPKQRAPAAERFGRDDIMSVLLNIDEKSPNFNTISLFKDGLRVSQPQPLPESLKGQTLYPTVSFKCMTVHVNFGMEPVAPLPFKCLMLADISQKDAAITSYPAPKDGKCEVVFPVGLPDEGSFDWLDLFHEKNPGYTELSDRMILDWAEKSGIWRQKGYKARTSNDKPDMNFGIRELDDNSVRRIFASVVALQPRNFAVMEVKSGLVKAERKELLSRFPPSSFKRVAHVIIGDPTSDFKRKTNDIVLKQKQEQADAEFRAKKAEEKRQKLMEKRQKELERAKKKAEKMQKKKEREMKKKLEAEKKAKEEAAKKLKEGAGEEKKEGEDVTMIDDDKEKEEEKEEEEEEDEEEEEKEPEDPEEEPPKVQLTADEKKILFAKQAVPDLTPYILSTSLGQFSIPDKEEGFDDIKFEWSKAPKAAEYIKNWISDKKLSTRVEDLVPSSWFNGKWVEWQKVLNQWHAKHNEYRASVAKKEALKAAKKSAAAAKPAPKKEDPAPMDEDKEKKEDEPAPMDEDKEKKEDEKKEEEEEEEKVDFENLDVFGVNDILDIGGREPLFKEFQFEDWTMMGLRFELHLLAHAFRHDVEDTERAGIHLDHLAFYYNKYYKKALSTKYYGVETFKELVDLVNDAVYVTKKQVLESQLDAEMECLQIFVKLTEEARRFRNLRLALGEEAAKLKLTQPTQYAPAQQGMQNKGGKRGGKGGWYNDKGTNKGKPSYNQPAPPFQHYNPPARPQPAPRTVAPRTVRPPSYRQSWNDNKGKGK